MSDAPNILTLFKSIFNRELAERLAALLLLDIILWVSKCDVIMIYQTGASKSAWSQPKRPVYLCTCSYLSVSGN